MDFDNLNKQQLAAATYNGKHLLVLAGAGDENHGYKGRKAGDRRQEKERRPLRVYPGRVAAGRGQRSGKVQKRGAGAGE